jgi:HPt (histidine-containing phosphotransfer) domain-containing protein
MRLACLRQNRLTSQENDVVLHIISTANQGTAIAAQPLRMDSAPGSIDTRNIVSVCQSGDMIDRALLREMLGYFIDENERRMTNSQEAVVNGDREGLRQLAHAMRGSAAMLGAGHLHDLLWSLEMDAEHSELQTLARAVAKIRQELDEVVKALRKAHPEAWLE